MNYRSQIIKIGSGLGGAGSVTTNIFNNLVFQPDEMIIRQFTYEGDVNATSYQLWSNIIDDGFLLVFTSGGQNITATNVSLDLHHDVHDKKISGGTFTFQVQSLTGDILTGDAIANLGDWALMLEFRKYKNH